MQRSSRGVDERGKTRTSDDQKEGPWQKEEQDLRREDGEETVQGCILL